MQFMEMNYERAYVSLVRFAVQHTKMVSVKEEKSTFVHGTQ